MSDLSRVMERLDADRLTRRQLVEDTVSRRADRGVLLNASFSRGDRVLDGVTKSEGVVIGCRVGTVVVRPTGRERAGSRVRTAPRRTSRPAES